jgi:hypothetical protein
MKLRRGFVLALFAAIVAACAGPSVPLDEPIGAGLSFKEAPSSMSVKALGALYRDDFSLDVVGGQPVGWKNVTAIGPSFPWLIPGHWLVTQQPNGTRALEQTGTSWAWFNRAPPLSFMRWNATTFGKPGNGLPERYVVDIGLKVVACDPHDPYFPIGDTGVQVYFVDPTHYCEVVYRPHSVEVWQCNGGQPFAFPGWTLLGRFSNVAVPFQTLSVHAQVDTFAHTLVVTLPGQASPLTFRVGIIQPGTHWLTLRASNSDVRYEHVTIQAF